MSPPASLPSSIGISNGGGGAGSSNTLDAANFLPALRRELAGSPTLLPTPTPVAAGSAVPPPEAAAVIAAAEGETAAGGDESGGGGDGGHDWVLALVLGVFLGIFLLGE